MSKREKTVAVSSPDPKNPSVTLVTAVPKPESKSDRVILYCTKCNKPISFEKGEEPQDAVMCKDCMKKEKESRIWRTCKNCGRKFYIKEAKAKQLQDAGLDLFTHCFECGQTKRDSRLNKGDE